LNGTRAGHAVKKGEQKREKKKSPLKAKKMRKGGESGSVRGAFYRGGERTKKKPRTLIQGKSSLGR